MNGTLTSPDRAANARRRPSRHFGTALSIAVPILLLVVWQVVAGVMHTVYIPTVSNIVVTFFQQWFSSNFTQEAVPSLYRMAAGYVFACLVGGGIGLLI